MAAPKSLILPMSVDCAKRRHPCQHNSKHMIMKGDLRLGVKSGRSPEYYCIECAQKFISLSMERLQKLSAELETQTAPQK
jgi:hypothetical protein